MYKFNQKYVAQGYFEECIDDSCPEMGLYTRDITRTFKKGEPFEAVRIKGNTFKLDDDSGYGSSLWGASVFVRIPDEVLDVISEEEFEKLQNRKKAENEYFYSLVHVNDTEDMLDKITKESEKNGFGKSLYQDYQMMMKDYVSCILEEIRARAAYIKAAL